jgi:hypothetical protein
MIEKALMYRAASMTLRAELAVADPAATLTDITRADNVARRARQDFERAITRTAPAKPPASIKEALRRG